MVVKAVVFDYGGVLVSYDQVGKFLAELAKQFEVTDDAFHAKKKVLFDLFLNSSDLMTGKLSLEEFEANGMVEAVNKIFGTTRTESIGWFQRFSKPDIFSKHKIMFDFIAQLRRNGIKTGLLTNNFWVDKEKKHDCTPVDKALFDSIVESREEGCEKPEWKIYDLSHSRLLKVDPSIKKEEVLFLDDLQLNLDGAEKYGWRGVLVENTSDPSSTIKKAQEIIEKENGSALKA
ncbi:unnamed protein product, partial [Mesorhabditis spiculigera]